MVQKRKKHRPPQEAAARPPAAKPAAEEDGVSTASAARLPPLVSVSPDPAGGVGGSAAAVVAPWGTGEDVFLFRSRLRDMFTGSELARGDTAELCTGSPPTLSLRIAVRSIFEACFFSGKWAVRVALAPPKESQSSCFAGCANLVIEGLYRSTHRGRKSVPLLQGSWREEEEGGEPAASQARIEVALGTYEALLQHLRSSAEPAASGAAVAGGNAADTSSSRRSGAFALLPVYPACGPTQADAESGQLIQRDTGVLDTRHFFVSSLADEHLLMQDAEDRLYIFESREDAEVWAHRMEFDGSGKGVRIVGLGEEKWKEHQRTMKITLVQKVKFKMPKGWRQHAVAIVAQSLLAGRESKLDVAEGAKLKGNEHFRKGVFEDALRSYDKSARTLYAMKDTVEGRGGDRWRQLLVDCRANAAQCCLQLGDNKAALAASEEVLQHQPDHAKALARKKKALEAIGETRSQTRNLGENPRAARWSSSMYFGEAEWELGVCLALAENLGAFNKCGVFPEILVMMWRSCCQAGEGDLRYDLLRVILSFVDFAEGRPGSRGKDENFRELERCVLKYRSRIAGAMKDEAEELKELLFASLLLKGVQEANTLSNNKAAVCSLREAWEMDCSQYHPWAEFLLARAYGGLMEASCVEAGLHHFRSVLYKLEQHLMVRPCRRVLDSCCLILGVHIHYETAMQEVMKFHHVTMKKQSAVTQKFLDEICRKLRELRDTADVLEERFRLENPWVPYVNIPAREHLAAFLAQYQACVSEQAAKANTERARRHLKSMMPCLRDDGEGNDVADIRVISTAREHQDSLDAVKAKTIEERKRALREMEAGQMDALDAVQGRLMRQTFDRHQEHAAEMDALHERKAREVAEAEEGLQRFAARFREEVATFERGAQQIHSVIGEYAREAEHEFARKEEALRLQHQEEIEQLEVAMQRKLTAELEKKRQEFKEQQEKFRAEREEKYQIFHAELEKKTSELEEKVCQEELLKLQEMQMFGEVQRLRRLIEDKDQEKERCLQDRLKAFETEKEEMRRGFEREKDDLEGSMRKLEESFATAWSRTSMPPNWTSPLVGGPGGQSSSDAASLGFNPVLITDPGELEALQQCLSVKSSDRQLGTGRDYAFKPKWPHSGFRLARAWRVENRALMQKFLTEKEKMRGDLWSEGLFPPAYSVQEELWTGLAEGIRRLPEASQLDAGLNETFLFHGTRPVTVPKIMHSGLNERVNQRGYFGAGTYLAEEAAKADQYVFIDWSRGKPSELDALHGLLYSDGPRSKSSGRPPHPDNVFYFLLCRVALGFPVRSFDGKSTIGGDGGSVRMKDKRGWDMNELASIPGTGERLAYHSLLVERYTGSDGMAADGTKHFKHVTRYREFVFTHSDRTYPQYLLAVHRA